MASSPCLASSTKYPNPRREEQISDRTCNSSSTTRSTSLPFNIASAVGQLTGIEHMAHLGCEPVRRERLLEIRHLGAEDAVSHDGVVGVARHEQHSALRMKLSEELSQHAAAHLGHDDVRQQEFDAVVPSGHFDGVAR